MLEIIEYVGVAVFAVSGALAAARRHLDMLGVIVIATVTAIGGGTLRDLLMNRHPVFWVAHPGYLYVILGAGVGTIIYTRRFRPPDRALALADALGLAFFTVSGAQIAEGRGLAGVVVVLMGAMTGVAGGVLRDILCAEIPLILRKGQIYATASILGACVYLVLQAVMNRDVAALVAMASIASLRIAAILFNWTLPVFPVK